jgi:hypothetical protein
MRGWVEAVEVSPAAFTTVTDSTSGPGTHREPLPLLLLLLLRAAHTTAALKFADAQGGEQGDDAATTTPPTATDAL